MSSILSLMSPIDLVAAAAVAVLAGVVKGTVGFAMPMIFVSALSTIMSPELAVAGLILPTLVTNLLQAVRKGGVAAVRATIRRFRLFMAAGLAVLVIVSQLVTRIPTQVFLSGIGLLVTFFAVLQLFGLRLSLRAQTPLSDVALGAAAGLGGGMAGVWGPQTVAYLTALNTSKSDQIRIQGVIYGLGSVALLLAHGASGIIRAETLPFSALLVVPAMAGMWLGGLLHDRIDQSTFRKATLLVLLIAGLNLLRRGLAG